MKTALSPSNAWEILPVGTPELPKTGACIWGANPSQAFDAEDLMWTWNWCSSSGLPTRTYLGTPDSG
ncbi:hypothetical protein ACMYSQ_010039 [Aspergillus niger]